MKKVSGLLSLLALCGMLITAGCSGSGSKGGNSPASSSSKEITSFEIVSPVTAFGIIDESAKTINVTVPYGTDVTKLIVKFVTTGVKTSIDSVEQTSSSSVNDFTSSLKYTVNAQDGSTSTYAVTVTIAKSDAKDITKFEISGQNLSVISGNAITVTMLFGTSGTTFIPTITHTGANISPASGVSQNFANPVDYTVTAADGSTKKYAVTVTVAAASTVNALSSLVLSAGTLSPAFASGTTSYTAGVDNSVSSITVTPILTDATASVTVNTLNVESGTASLPIILSVGSNSVTVRVTSQSGSPKEYSLVITREYMTSVEAITLKSGTSFKIIESPTVSGTSPQFPTETNDSTFVNVPESFYIAETDVTYQLWKEVYDWATDSARGTDMYIFANKGQNGATSSNDYIGFSTNVSSQFPVTYVNWRDAIIWCNALTEYLNANSGGSEKFDVVYCSDAAFQIPIRTSTNSTTITYSIDGSQDAPYVNPTANGFRLPSCVEYEFASRYIGTIKPFHNNYVMRDGVYYYKGNSASGATSTYTDNVITSLYAVFCKNYTSIDVYTSVAATALVKSKYSNALGLYDMSGNVFKWNFDWHPKYIGQVRRGRGGSFTYDTFDLRVGFINFDGPCYPSNVIGFRPVKSK